MIRLAVSPSIYVYMHTFYCASYYSDFLKFSFKMYNLVGEEELNVTRHVRMSVTLQTTLGDIKIELYCDLCPKTCEVSNIFLLQECNDVIVLTFCILMFLFKKYVLKRRTASG